MLGLKRPKFKSRKDAYGTFFSNFMSPPMIVGLGIAGVSKSGSFGLISSDQAKQSIFFVIVISVIVLIYCWYKAFWAVSAIMNDDYGNTPETVICMDCREPFLSDRVNDLKCPKCGGTLEDLDGFYERYPKSKE